MKIRWNKKYFRLLAIGIVFLAGGSVYVVAQTTNSDRVPLNSPATLPVDM